jgi:hypothetical protein
MRVRLRKPSCAAACSASEGVTRNGASIAGENQKRFIGWFDFARKN